MIITSNKQETIAYGKKIATQLKGGDILLLQGDLGAGKTTLVKGIAQGLKIKNKITSPTFSLMNIYDAKIQKNLNIKTLVHIDTYRLENENALIEIGVEDYLGQPDTVCIIEWPEKLDILLKNKKTISINIVSMKNNNRKIKISN